MLEYRHSKNDLLPFSYVADNTRNAAQVSDGWKNHLCGTEPIRIKTFSRIRGGRRHKHIHWKPQCLNSSVIDTTPYKGKRERMVERQHQACNIHLSASLIHNDKLGHDVKKRIHNVRIELTAPTVLNNLHSIFVRHLYLIYSF